MTNTYLKNPNTPFFYSLFIIFFFSFSSISYGWSGYDFDNKIDIEIDEGNLVREGLLIQFYDSKTDSYHSAKVLLLESDPGGTMLQIKHLELNSTRTFIMNN